MRTLATLALAAMVGGCGATTTTTGGSPHPSRAADHDPPVLESEPVVTSCAPARSGLRFELPDLPPEITSSTYDANTCMLVPSDAPGDPPIAFVVMISARERDTGELRSVDERLEADAPVIGRGELQLLGGPRPSVALGGEQFLVGEGEAHYAVVHLVRHTVDVVIAFRSTTPAPVRAQILAALARMRVVGLERATDARLHDPSLALCEADGLSLLVPVPEGGMRQENWETQCMIAPHPQPDVAPWSIWIGSFEVGDPDAASLDREPDGARQWGEGTFVDPRFVEEGTISLLGAPARWAAFDARYDAGAPLRRIAVVRGRRGDRHVLAVLVAPLEEPARLPLLLDALARVREP